MSEKAAAVDAWEALFRAQVTVMRSLTADWPSSEITMTEYDVLFNLSRQEQRALRIRDLGPHLLLTQPSISRMVDRLAQRDLVTKTPDPGDGRGTIVTLTDAGYALFRTVAVRHAAAIQQRMSVLDADELAVLTAVTDKLRLHTT